MNWEELLAEYRELGGIAENADLRQGSLGRGIFPIDPEKPVRLRTPPNLLVASADTELQADKLVVKQSANVGKRERLFFERYQENFSWGAGTLNDLWQGQLAWRQLPGEVQEKLLEIGPADADRFAEPTMELCYRRYLATRQFNYRGTPVLMPVMELINHRDQAPKYDSSDGIGVECKSADEVGINYGPSDCWGMTMNYGFLAARRWAHSLIASFTFEDHEITIYRKFSRRESVNGVPLPMVEVNGDKIGFSFLMLGNTQRPRIPRAAFLHVAKTTPIKQPEELFDRIQHDNRIKLLGFLRLADGLSLPLATLLRSAAYQQLETLSAHIGTRDIQSDT